MSTETDPRALEAIVKARRIARNAELVEIAKGKQPWQVWVVPSLVILAFGYLTQSGTLKIGGEWFIIASVVFIGWLSSWRTERRLDAVVQLLLNERAARESELAARA
jgi:hypothetical protein